MKTSDSSGTTSSPDVSLVSSVCDDSSDCYDGVCRFVFLFFFLFLLDFLDLLDRERFKRSSSSEGPPSSSGAGADATTVVTAGAAF